MTSVTYIAGLGPAKKINGNRVVAESSKLSQVGCADEQCFKRIPLALFKLELSRKRAAHG